MSTDPQKSTKDVAADQAKHVAGQTKEVASGVAGTAKEQGQALLSETTSHARGLLQQARTELTDQAGMQQMRAGDLLRTLATELQEMAGASSQTSGLAAGLVGDVAGRADGAARWLDQRQPAEVLDEVRRFARRKPGAFLATAAVVGFLGGRLTRGLTAQDDELQALPAGRHYADAGYDRAGYVETGYDRTGTYTDTYTDTYRTAGTTAGYATQPAGYVEPGTTSVGYGTQATDEPFDQYSEGTIARPATGAQDSTSVTFDGDAGAR